MIVVDASALVEVLFRRDAAEAVEERLFDEGETLHAPHLLDMEVAHAIRRFALLGEIDDVRGRASLLNLSELPISRYAHDFLLPRIWELRHNLTAYDAAYVALAEVLDAPLLTRDGRLARSSGHRARIELI